MSVYCEECGGSVHNRLCIKCEGKERRAENAKLREALERHGYHDHDCSLLNDSEERGGLGIEKCDCGLTAALAGKDDKTKG